jgi:hypothetical protein
VAAASGRKERKRKACLSLPTHNGIGLVCEDSEASHHRGKHMKHAKRRSGCSLALVRLLLF